MKKKILMLLLLGMLTNLSAKDSIKIQQTAEDKLVSGKIAGINRIRMAVRNDGNFAGKYNNERDVYIDELQFDELHLIYASGLWLAANVEEEKRASISFFNVSDFTEGAIDINGSHYGEDDSLLFRVYKINRGDDAASNPDYRDWPISLGAPADADGNPLFLGDQVLWTSFSDSYGAGRLFDKSLPLGAEIHLTVWADESIDNVIFLHWEIINKSDSDWQQAFTGIFVDPDMEMADDDLIGSDSTANMVYCFESVLGGFDKKFQAIGYILLETPNQPLPGGTAVTWMGEKNDYENVPAASPMLYKYMPDEWSEEIFWGEECTPTIIYDRLNCKDKDGNAMINPLTGQLSRWAFCGDPVSRTGWLDDSLGIDRRMMISAGPFDLAAGDTSGVTLAILPVRGKTRLFCVSNLKSQARAAQSFFRDSFGIFSKSMNTYEGKKNLQLPISMINDADLQKIEFTLSFEPQNIVFDSLVTSEATSGFSIMTQKNDSVVSCSLESPGLPLAPGKNDIGYAVFHVKSPLASDTAKISISNVVCSDQFNAEHRIPGTQAILSFYKAPSSSRLMFPANDQFIDGLSVKFRWTQPPEVETNVYQLVFLNEKLHKFNRKMLESDFSMAVEDFLANGCHDVSWTVNIITPDSVIASPDTFHFRLPDSTQLQIVEKLYNIELPPDTSFDESITAIAEHEGLLYVFTRMVPHDNSGNVHNGALIYRLEENQAQLVNRQDLETDRYYDEIANIQFVGNELFAYVAYKGTIYEIGSDFHLTKVGMFYFSASGGALQMNDKIFTVYHTYDNPPDLKEFTLRNNYSVRETAHYNLADWKVPTEMKSRMDLHFPFLYLAMGSWGVFYVQNPDTIRLLARREVEKNATAVVRSLPYLYVGTSGNRLYVYDATWYSNPQLLHWEQTISPEYQQSSIDKMVVFGDHLCFAHRWGTSFTVCHFEPGDGFKLDGFMNGQDVLFSGDKVIIRKGNGIAVWRNNLFTQVAEKNKPQKMTFEIFQNYPNPFNPSTTIKFSLEKAGNVKLEIFNVLGQEVAELINRQLLPGNHSVKWDGKDNAGNFSGSGVYFARLTAGHKTRIIKMALLR